jgi:type IV secretion system protein VirD4
VAILADPAGGRDDEAIWDKAASEILEAVILHVLYAAPDPEKTLIKVRDLLADLDTTAETMISTLHRDGPDGAPQTHPFIRTAVQGHAAMHDRFRTSVQGTARSYLKWLAGEDVERTLSASDLRLADLMCAPAPVSLYVQAAPADAQALRPLVRLLFHAATQALTAHEATDDAGRPKRRRLLLVMDEFPLLGRIAFFEKSLRLMSGYGLKAMFVAQSLNDIVETYGPNNTILDNCHAFTAFAALDPMTQDKVSRLTGLATELRTTRSGPAGLGAGHRSTSRSEIERPLLEPGEIRALPDDRQLIFVAGHRPLRARKLRYDRREPFRSRAALPPPDQARGVDAPDAPTHPWAGRRARGADPQQTLPLFKEVEAAIQDRKAAARVAEVYERMASDLAAEQALLDHFQAQAYGQTPGGDHA